MDRDRDRVEDEKRIEKLYRDIANGGLRRRRGADFDLSDSEDEAAERRRKAKQREFAKMRKALLEDENIEKIATNPKKMAFLAAIEDRETGEDVDFLDQPQESSQTAMESHQNLPVEDRYALKRKDPPEDSSSVGKENRPPAPERRTKRLKKPSTIAEIRESVSFLIEDPNNESQCLEYSDDERQTEPLKDRAPFSERRTANSVVDRIALARSGSSVVTVSGSTRAENNNLAFHAPSGAASSSAFRVPNLLRRATTNLSNASNTENSNAKASSALAVKAKEAGLVKMGGSRKSSINYFAREQEKKKVVVAVEKRRVEGRTRMAGLSRQRSGLTGLAGGDFE